MTVLAFVNVRWLGCVVGLFVASSIGLGAEIIRADGRREPVTDPKQDSQGAWVATIEGHRTILKPGDVVVIVDDAGKETVTIPEFADPPDPPETAAMLASLSDPKNDAWQTVMEPLAKRPSKAIHDALVALSTNAKKPLRDRAVRALLQLHTRASVMAAAAAILAEKDKRLRVELASALYSAQEIYKRCDCADSLKAGIADPDRDVRLVFATLAPQDDATALTVLKNDGLKHSDHHQRESAAVEVGRRGDKSGESILVSMLAWTKLDVSEDAALNDRILGEQQVEVCEVLGTFGTPAAKTALEKAKASKLECVRKAAEAALAKK
jgi:HEAT repeat protein